MVAPGTPPILVIGNTGDPVTPYAASVSVAASLADAVLLTLDGARATPAAGRSGCIDDAVRTLPRAILSPPPPAPAAHRRR